MIMVRMLLLVIITLAGAQAFAADPALYSFENPAKQARYHDLLGQLRCLVCQNESLADSHADLAGDMRREIYEKMKEGATNQDVTNYLVQRYGDFVLFRPPMQANTYLLWFGPALLFLVGFGVFIVVMQRRHKTLTPALSEAEHHRMAKLLEEED